MSLRVWIPFTDGTVKNQGTSNLTFTNSNSSITYSNNSGKLGKCILNTGFSGGGFISNTTINLGTNISMFCWVNPTAFTASANLNGIITNHHYESSSGMGLVLRYASSTTGYIGITEGRGSNGRTYDTHYGNTLLTAGNWYHIGFTYNGSTVTFYLNGNPDGTKSISGLNAVANYIGIFRWSDTYTSDYEYKGLLNDVRIYDHCLTPQEVKEISKGLALHYTLTSNCLVEATTNVGSNAWQTYEPYWNNLSGSYGNWQLTKNSGSQTLAITNSTISSAMSAGLTWTLSGYLYKNGVPYKTSISNPSTYSGYSILSWESRDDGYFRYTMYINSVSGWLIHSEMFGNDNTQGSVVQIRCLQFELKDHATLFTPTSRSTGYAYDSSGYCKNGTLDGAFTFNPSIRYDKCSEVVTNGRIIYPMQTFLEFTYSYWIKRNRISHSLREMLGTGWYGVSMEMNEDNSLTFRHYLNSSGTFDVRTSALFTSTTDWYHIVLTRNSSGVSKIYVNGIERASGTNTNTINYNTSSAELFTYAGSTYLFRGRISDFRVYATALSQQDITDLYSLGATIS